MTDKRGKLEESPFSNRVSRDGTVFISWCGKTVTTLRGKPAEVFQAKIADPDEHGQQLAMARATGHFKHGNERR